MSLSFLKDTILNQVYNFSYGGYSFHYLTPVAQFHYMGLNGYIAPYSFQTSVNGNVNYSVTAELTINQDGVTATSGQFSLTASAHSGYTTYSYSDFSSNPGYKLVMPWNDGRTVTVHIVIRVNGAVQKDTTFQTSAPANVQITSLSPSTPQTGKICTATLSNSIPSGWTVQKAFTVYAYHDTSSTAEYNWRTWNTYYNNGVNVVDVNSRGFTQFQFYVWYNSSFNHSDNTGKIEFNVRVPDIIDLRVTKSSGGTVYYVTYIDYSYAHSFTWSYVNQTDSNAGPAITLSPVTFTPTNVLTKYGRYVGGGITNLTFGWSVQNKFGGAFQSVLYQLYNSGGTLLNSWSYSSLTALSLRLQDTVDISYYVRVTVTSTIGTSSSATYSTFNVYGYSYPYISSLEVRRCNQDGTANDSGAYCRISWAFKVTPLGNVNTKTVVLVAPDGSHTFTSEDYDRPAGYYYISAADIEHSYAISLSITDDFQTVTKTVNISTAGVIMDFLYDGKGIGLGKVAETTEMVEVNPQWTFKADKMTFKGQDLETILTSLGYVFPT